MRYSKALVRKPCKNIIRGLTTANLGVPDYNLANEQHNKYIDALKSCGLEVFILDADEEFPDSVFIEDTALLTPSCAIITNPGSPARRGETKVVEEFLNDHFSKIERINHPGALDAGDVMMVGDHFFIGLSSRSNKDGAEQLISILNLHGFTGSTVALKRALHLKSGISYLENNILIASSEFANRSEFAKFDVLPVADKENYSANCIWINDRALIPAGYPDTRHKIEERGLETIELEMSEFRKLDGGLSCLSLRF